MSDLVSNEKSHNDACEKLKSEMKEVQTRLSKKEEATGKLEKDRREALIAKDKANKVVETARAERDQAKKGLETLEAEKRANNFGKYEREKMKSELDGVQQVCCHMRNFVMFASV